MVNLTQSFLFMLQHWMFSNWRPSLIVNRAVLKFHFSFGSKLTASSLIDTVYSNSYNIVIGKFFSPALVGYYNQADTFRLFPVSQLSFALDKVTYPLFSTIQENDKKLKEKNGSYLCFH